MEGEDSASPERAREAALVRRVQQELPHGTRAFRELVQAYTPRVYARALRLVASGPDAEDVVQDVFLRVFRAIGRFQFERPFGHWLQTITTNAARNFLRGRHRDQRKRTELAQARTRDTADTQDPSDPLLRAQLERALDELDPTTRVAVVLRYVEERSFPEIAEELSMGQSAVKMRVRRGVERLRAELGGSES